MRRITVPIRDLNRIHELILDSRIQQAPIDLEVGVSQLVVIGVATFHKSERSQPESVLAY